MPLPRWKNFFVPLAAVVILLPLIFVGWYNLKYPKSLHAHFQVSLGKNAAVTVPLVERNGGIFVMASLNGQSQLCQIDTGSDTVNWRRGLYINGEMTSERGKSCDALNNCISLATVKLPEIKIGSYKVTDIPTEMQEDNSVLFSSVAATPADGVPLLGNALFSLAVMTIDYQKKTPTFHAPTYNFTKQARLPTDKILEMGWTSHSDDSPTRQQVIGWPVIRARTEGKPFWRMIDTGWEGTELGLTTEFFRQLPRNQQGAQQKSVGHFAYGISVVRQEKSLTFQIPVLQRHVPPVVLTEKGWIVKLLSGGAGIVGTTLMQRFRITLDYPHRRVLLEPYAHKASRQKQEKRGRSAKQPSMMKRGQQLGRWGMGLGLLAALCLTGCRNGGGDDSAASVRLINAVPDAGGLDVSVGGKSVWRQAEFRSSTGYKKVPSGEYPVQIAAAGPGTTLLTKTLAFDKKQSYTLLALGQAQPGGAPARVQVLPDDSVPLPPGHSALRLVNAAPGTASVDLVINTIVGLKSVGYGRRSVPVLLDAGRYTVQLAVPNTAQMLVGAVTLDLKPGQSYTLIAEGQSSNHTLTLEAYPDK